MGEDSREEMAEVAEDPGAESLVEGGGWFGCNDITLA